MEFAVVDVSGWTVVGQEPEGAEPKEWISPSTDTPDPWLYKRPKVGVETGYRRYDDVAERLASALAADIGLPAARVEFAHRGDEIYGAPLTISECLWPH